MVAKQILRWKNRKRERYFAHLHDAQLAEIGKTGLQYGHQAI